MTSGNEPQPPMEAPPNISRGDTLTRFDYHTEFSPDTEQMYQKDLGSLLGVMKARRGGWPLMVAIVNPSTRGAGSFMADIVKAGVEPTDYVTLVQTDSAPIDATINEIALGTTPHFDNPPRIRPWRADRPSQRREIARHTYDIVFVAASSPEAVEAADQISTHASLFVADIEADCFQDVARLEVSPARASFAYRVGQAHLMPMMTDGTEQDVAEFSELTLSACKSETPGKCAEGPCPAKRVAGLVMHAMTKKDIELLARRDAGQLP